MYAQFDALARWQHAAKRGHNSRWSPAPDLLKVALLPGIFQCLNRPVLRAQRPDSRPNRSCSHGSQRSPLHQPAGPGRLGKYEARSKSPASPPHFEDGDTETKRVMTMLVAAVVMVVAM